MTDDEILQMGLRSGCVEEVKLGIDVYRFDIIGLRNFVALVAASERETCLDIAEDEIKRVKPIYSPTADIIFRRIRDRGQS
jgi:hypothetical protein